MGYQLAAKVLYMHHLTDRIAHTMTFVKPVVAALWGIKTDKTDSVLNWIETNTVKKPI